MFTFISVSSRVHSRIHTCKLPCQKTHVHTFYSAMLTVICVSTRVHSYVYTLVSIHDTHAHV